MTTIVNTPPSGESRDSGAGIILGVIIALVLIALFFIYALPAIRSTGSAPRNDTVDVNVKLPPAEAVLPSTPPANPSPAASPGPKTY